MPLAEFAVFVAMAPVQTWLFQKVGAGPFRTSRYNA